MKMFSQLIFEFDSHWIFLQRVRILISQAASSNYQTVNFSTNEILLTIRGDKN